MYQLVQRDFLFSHCCCNTSQSFKHIKFLLARKYAWQLSCFVYAQYKVCLCFPTLHKVKVTVFFHYKVALGNKKKSVVPLYSMFLMQERSVEVGSIFFVFQRHVRIGFMLIFQTKEVLWWYRFTCSLLLLRVDVFIVNVIQQWGRYSSIQLSNSISNMPGGKEYLVLFELCFCNLRFKFRFLDVPLDIEYKLIIVSNFLHLVPKPSANKPAVVTLGYFHDHRRLYQRKVQSCTMFYW